MNKILILPLLYSIVFCVTCELPDNSNNYRIEPDDSNNYRIEIEEKDYEFRFHYYNIFDELVKTELYKVDINGFRGVITGDINYKDGLIHGLSASYCNNGDTELALLFNSGKIVKGTYKSIDCEEPWRDRVEVNCHGNNVEFIEYSRYHNWILSKETFENNFTKNPPRLDGIVERYLNNKLEYEGYYSYGEKVGLHIYYYPNGDIEKIEGDFDIADINSDNNISLHDIVILIDCMNNQECSLNYYNQINHLDLISIVDNVLEN